MINTTAILVTAAFIFLGLIACVIWERMAAREAKRYEKKVKQMEPDLDEYERKIS